MSALTASCSSTVLSAHSDSHIDKLPFPRYVENVFRLQNSVTSEVMMLLDSLDAKNQATILLAEQHMHKVCQPLNDYANRASDGLNTGLWLKIQVEHSTLDCELAAKAVQSALNKL